MKESISYAFLLNIVIIFIFTCAAIIMGVFSYYKAFRANTIISETIEKYEGYNCVSKEEIERKLSNIGYNTPFEVSCKKGDGNCDDSGEGYKVISYNLDFQGNLVYDGEQMNSSYICDNNGCTTNKHYQYGIYTYMYVDLPVISSLIRIPFFSKTSILYEFRNFYVEETKDERITTDVEQIFDQLYDRKYIDGKLYVKDAYYGKLLDIYGEQREDYKANDILVDEILEYYAVTQTGRQYSFMNLTKNGSDNLRNDAYIKMLESKGSGSLTAIEASNILKNGLNGEYFRRNCGTTFDYSSIN